MAATLAACILVAVTAVADSGRLYTADKLTSSLISCISQDKYGYIWVGTENGLNKFDGYRFTNYIKDNLNENDSTSLISNDITPILSDRQGRLWIGSELGLMTYDIENDRFRHHRFPDGIKPRVQDILQASNGDIIIGTAGYGLYRIKAGTSAITPDRRFGSNDKYAFASKLFIDRRGDIWLSNHLRLIAIMPYRHTLTTRGSSSYACTA